MTPEEIKEANLKLWRRMALLKEQPGKKPDNRWNVYLAENLSWKAEGQTFGDRVTEMKASFDNLSAQQKEVSHQMRTPSNAAITRRLSSSRHAPKTVPSSYLFVCVPSQCGFIDD
jgi:hypothetical protein